MKIVKRCLYRATNYNLLTIVEYAIKLKKESNHGS